MRVYEAIVTSRTSTATEPLDYGAKTSGFSKEFKALRKKAGLTKKFARWRDRFF